MMRLLSRTNNAQRIGFARRLSWLVADLIAILIRISEVGHVPDGLSTVSDKCPLFPALDSNGTGCFRSEGGAMFRLGDGCRLSSVESPPQLVAG
jgi:hypothetical protein